MTRPWMLWVLLPMAAVLVGFFVRSLSDFPKSQRIASLATRFLIAIAIVLALSGLTYLRTTDEKWVVFLADQSLSIRDDAAQIANDFLSASNLERGSNQAVWIPFARHGAQPQDQMLVYPIESKTAKSDPENAIQNSPDKSPENPTDKPTDKPSIDVNHDTEQIAAPKISDSSTTVSNFTKEDRDGSNIQAAIEAAAGFMPPGYVPQIVLLSDGNETLGDALATVARSRIPISTVPLPTSSEPEVQVASVEVPAEVQEGAPFYVDVLIQSNHDDEGLVEVFRGDHKVVSEKRALKKGSNKFRFQQSIERERLAAFTVRVSGLQQDTLLDNNTESGLAYCSGKPRVLIIESDPNLIRELAYALEDEGIQVDVRPPQGMPESLSDLQNYECLILSNVPATALTSQQMMVARTYVQELGGGFMMLGGEQSFGLGGYYKSTLEEILPVRSDFEKEKEKPSLGMVLVIDKSGSMSGDKIEMAKSAARSAVELLGRRDSVAVIAFDGDSYVISEMQSATNTAQISGDIARIEAGGGTTMYPAMELSYEMLTSTQAKLKHVILLTDGVSSPGDFEGLAQTMSSAKITVSTVAVGDGSDTALLEAIAKTGKGRHYETNDPSQVPQIFAKETVTASKSAIDEQPFIPQVILATHALADIDMDSAPFLLGYVMTRPKPTSEVILATEKGDPLLAWWRYGLGMTAAFTSDAKSRWAAEWLTWPGYGKFWTQVVRQIMRKSDMRGIQTQVLRSNQEALIAVDAVSDIGQYLNDAKVEVTLIDPSLKQVKRTLRQSAPGRYDDTFGMRQQGAYHMEISVTQNDQVLYRQSRGTMLGYSDELRIRPTNDNLLQQIASVSGGKFSPTPKEVFQPDGRFATRPLPLWPFLLTAAAMLLVLDVMLRRIDFSSATLF